MSDESPSAEPADRPASKPGGVERLYPFVVKTRGLLIGRESLRANKGKLHFVLITEDIAAEHRDEVLKNFAHYPVVQHYQQADLETFFNVKGAKAVGFVKSGLAQSIYAELKPYRINSPLHPAKPSGSPPTPPTGHTAS
jgi:hypothetical protein